MKERGYDRAWPGPDDSVYYSDGSEQLCWSDRTPSHPVLVFESTSPIEWWGRSATAVS